MNKDIQKQIQQDYKSNLLKRQMIADEFRYKKHKYIPEKPPENSREDYTLKDGVHLSQDESFNDLLSALQTTEDAEAEEDIEEHIARYHIIEEKIQKNFQETTQETPQDTTPEDTDPKKTYAQEFIENARRGGYEVKLDANLKVKSVKKINKIHPDSAGFMEKMDEIFSFKINSLFKKQCIIVLKILAHF